MEIDKKFKYNLFSFILIFWVLVISGRLFFLQVLQGSKYKTKSYAQAIKADIIYPFRGNFYDRNGKLLVYNSPSYSLQIFLGSFRKDRIPLLCYLLGIDTTEFYNVFYERYKFLRFGDVKLFTDLDYQTVLRIEENLDLLPGVDIVCESKRQYNLPAKMSHIIGYVQEIDAKDLEREPYYSIGDPIGKTGLERAYETELRGQKGKKFVGILPSGIKTTRFIEAKQNQMVINGNDLYLTIDEKLQIRAEELLEGRRGAIVAIDPNNGEILAMVSKPDYEVTEFSGKNSSKNYLSLLNNPDKPLLNRAIQARYPPGSTWKPLMAIAALEEGIINEKTTFYCPGELAYGDVVKKCHGAHGSISVRRAIQTSCNVFFYYVGLRLGLDKISHWSKLFGFGNPTGIDLPGENPGIMPDSNYLKKRFGKYLPKGLLLNYGIGQGEINVTPLQLACYVAAIANGGTYYKPHLVRAIKNSIINQISYFEPEGRKVPVSDKTLAIIKNAMFDVVNVPGGTAYGIMIPGIDICGKTGTAQNPRGMDHSWFICFAPKDNPKIAIAVIAENAGFGAAVAAPIAQELIKTYFNIQTPATISDTLNLFGD